MNSQNSNKYNFFFKGGNKAVLLIHGITGTPSEMRYLGSCLDKGGYTAFCNTLPKHCNTLNELKKVTWQEIADACTEDLMRLKQEFSQVFVAGLSMGALMGVHLACKFPSEVSGVIALAPTLFYDGWANYKGKFLLNFVWHIPFLRNAIDVRESWPYGLKDENLRNKIDSFYKNAKASQFYEKVFLFGSPFFPIACLYQAHLFAQVVKKELSRVEKPILIIHAREDDMTSPKNAQYIYDNIASQKKYFVLLEDSYHMITIDKEKDRVAQETVEFLDKFSF
jgi:carboxylesterase